jgi:hypothetical protein
VGACEFVGGEPGERRHAAGNCLDLCNRGRRAQRDSRAGIGGKRVKTIKCAVSWLVRGNGHAAGVERAEECRNEFQAWWVRNHDSLARKAHVLKTLSDCASTAIKLRVGHYRLLRLVNSQMHKRGVIRTLSGVSSQGADQTPVTGMRHNR